MPPVAFPDCHYPFGNMIIELVVNAHIWKKSKTEENKSAYSNEKITRIDEQIVLGGKNLTSNSVN